MLLRSFKNLHVNTRSSVLYETLSTQTKMIRSTLVQLVRVLPFSFPIIISYKFFQNTIKFYIIIDHCSNIYLANISKVLFSFLYFQYYNNSNSIYFMNVTYDQCVNKLYYSFFNALFYQYS